jgi:hypothetical protein
MTWSARLPPSRTFIAAAIAALAAAGCNLKTHHQLIEEGRESYVGDHPELDDPTREAIRSGALKPGMTYDQVAAAWGAPVYVNRFDGGRSVEWVFGCDYPGVCSYQDRRSFGLGLGWVVHHTRAYFYDGRLTGWRTT